MKVIAAILVIYMSVLMVTPAVCGTCTVLMQSGLCCNDKEQTDNKQSNNNTTCTPCCSIQSCHCSFVAVPQFNFLVQVSINTKKAPTKNDKVLSNYLSDCWHPPELV